MKFVSKYRRYSITLDGKKYSFTPEGVTGVFFTNDEKEISALKGSAAFGRDYHVTGEVQVDSATDADEVAATSQKGKKK
ncbi:hypothetical protein MASR1M107_12470 [Ignavibacteriales bacterium]